MELGAQFELGNLTEAIRVLTAEVRKSQGDAKARRKLFALNCLCGRLDKARDQIDALVSLEAVDSSTETVYNTLIDCEKSRQGVFRGEELPVIFGAPPSWGGAWCEANRLISAGEIDAACSLFESCRAAGSEKTSGRLAGIQFSSIEDSDSRLAPFLEAYVEGRYFWIPWNRIRSIRTSQPTHLVDLVWIGAECVWDNGGTAHTFLPVRYPGTESLESDSLRLARTTEWDQPREELFLGKGQKLFFLGESEISLLEFRGLEFDLPVPAI